MAWIHCGGTKAFKNKYLLLLFESLYYVAEEEGSA